MSNHFFQVPNIQAIHTAVKGRVRYKIDTLYRSESLKKHLELKLLQKPGILQVRPNHLTGNVLVIFEPGINLDEITSILRNIVLDYSQHNQLFLTQISHQESNGKTKLNGNYQNKRNSVLLMKMLLDKQLSQASHQIIKLWATVGTLALSTGLLYYSGLDKSILLLIQKLHSPVFDRLMLGVTFLGEPSTLLLICLALVMSPFGSKPSEKAASLGITTVGGVALNYLLKVRFGRVRPALWERLINVGHYSFPSGHAMMSIVTYGFIAYLLAEQFPQWQKEIYTLSILLIAAIGFSRLYLGVHWPTDVLAGYAVGLVWLSACIFAFKLWQAYEIENKSKSLTIQSYPSPQLMPSVELVNS